MSSRCEFCASPVRGLCSCEGARRQREECQHNFNGGTLCILCGASQRQLASATAERVVRTAFPRHTPYVVCRHCGKTKEEHKPASDVNRMRAKTPCLLWRENFSPRLYQPNAAAIPRCHNCGMVVSREGAPCERAIPCGRPPLGVLMGLGALTDTHRLSVVRELWQLHIDIKGIHMDQTLTEYERLIRERAT